MRPGDAFRGPFGFDFLRPSWLALVVLGLILLLLAWSGLRRRRRERAQLVAERHVQRFLPGYSELRARARILLAGSAAALMALALAGPVRGWTVREIERRGIDLVLCIDTSRSMLVRDLRPDRLARAKREVRGLLERMSGDRVAILSFAGDVREVAPLTHDRTTLVKLLETISTDDYELGGTDLGAALQRALSMFDGRTGSHEAIVLLTDGEDLGGRGLEMAQQAAELGIRVFVVGMGTPQGGKIPITLEDGREGFVTDREGNEVVSALDGSTLEQLADVTGGEYLAATQSAVPLEELYDKRITQLEAHAQSAGEEWVPHDRFQWALVLALGCMLVESGLRERRKLRPPSVERRAERKEAA